MTTFYALEFIDSMSPHSLRARWLSGAACEHVIDKIDQVRDVDSRAAIAMVYVATHDTAAV